ncbi:hypothetical protein DFH29DRAFT_995588 [Suillus ampliporus]|nr:hypothetical protein DFH29DRAFT_995588 [Suillus ampliporus]
MDRILADPALEAQPNFESAAYAGWLNAFTAGGTTREDALDKAKQMHVHSETRKSSIEPRKKLKSRKNGVKPKKKKPKINDFDANATVADILVPRPSQFALQKIKNMEYVELWYFSPDGCRDAADNSRSSSEDAYGFAKVEGMVALKPVASFKASQKALQDHDLSWRQFDLAKTSYLVHLEKCSWPEKHQQALAMFFMLITNHEHRTRSCGEKTLLHYAGFGFNIGIFNNALYNTLSDDVWEAEHDEGIKLVHPSPPVFRPITNATFLLPPFV